DIVEAKIANTKEVVEIDKVLPLVAKEVVKAYKLIKLELENGEEIVLKRKEYTSKYKGVYRCKGEKKWKSSYTINGEQKYIGSFLTEEEAYNKLLKQLNKIYWIN
ncbi:hypothetical protein LCGC14_3164420, partial [marine sediment metagenome]